MFAIQDRDFKRTEETFRFVIDNHGQLIYISDSLTDRLEQDNISSIQDILVFDNPKKAFGERKSDGAKKIKAGVHAVRFKIGVGHKVTSEKYELQFDWINTQDAGENYLVAASIDINTPKDPIEAADMLEAFIMKVTQDQLQEGQQDNQPSATETPTKTTKKTVAKKTAKKTVKKAKPAKLKTYAGKAEQKEARLKNNETQMFMQMSSELQAIIEPTGSFVRFNTNFSRMLGFEDTHMLDKSFIALVHPDDRNYVRNALFAVSENNGIQQHSPSIHFEIRMIDGDLGVHWVEWQFKTIESTIFTLGRDITESKTAEQRLKTQENRLQEAQALAHMGHWRWTIGRNEVEWSQELYKIFGIDQSQTGFIPSIETIHKLVHRRDNGRVIQTFQRAIIEKRNYEIDFRIYRDDGAIRYMRCEGRCDLDEDGDVRALFGIMQDVTERLQHERALREAKDASERAYAAKSQFLANMSHELRTPLNAIIGFSEMMQRQLLGPIGTEKYLDYITGIRESGEHLLDLISDILDMSKIEAGKYELDLEDINLAKISKLAIHMMQGRAQESEIKLSFDTDNPSSTIAADRRAVMQILLNLLSNSVKFTKRGGNVGLSVNQRKEFVAITVTDTGIGIPAHKLADITMPFEQVECEYSREYDGSGLGLSITKDLAELHGGKVEIESEVDQGTSVTILLPQGTQIGNA